MATLRSAGAGDSASATFGPRGNRRFGVFFLCLAGLLLALSGWFYAKDRQFLEGSAIAHGVVTAVEKSATLPTIRYEIAGAGSFTFKPSFRTALTTYAVGQHVDVVYRRAAPDEARLNAASHIWASTHGPAYGAAILAALGLLTVKGILRWGPLKQKRLSVGL